MKKKNYRIMFMFVLFLFVPCVFYYYHSSFDLTVSEYSIKTDISSPIRIAHLSDLHNVEFGDENSELINMVRQQEPNLIVMSGDMINREEENLSVIRNLISGLSEIAPIYYGYGNHEIDWEETWEKDLNEELSDEKVVVLNNKYVLTTICGEKVVIGGYMGYYHQPHMLTTNGEQRIIERAFADEFDNRDQFKILINHIPTAWVDWDYINKYPVDVVFSGHYHGGMIRIPFIDRGVYAPYVGWFPPHTKGIFAGSQATCVLSAGLGSEHRIPRFNNPPEIAVVDLVPYSE